MAARIRLAVAQAAARIGDVRYNTNTVEQLVHRLGSSPLPSFVLFPEAFPQGYSYDYREVWACADVIEGSSRPDPTTAPAASKLCAIAAARGVYIGTTLVERVRYRGNIRGGNRIHEDILNTFVVAQPDGTLARERPPKRFPVNFEAYVFKGGVRRPGGRIVSTPLGRIGVGICYDNYHASTHTELAAEKPDFIVLPHCAPIPRPAILGMPESEVAQYSTNLAQTASRYARVFNVPVAYTNQTGTFDTVCPAWYLKPLESNMTRNGIFPGGAYIAAAGTGTRLVELGTEPGIVSAEVDVGPSNAGSDISAAATPDISELDPHKHPETSPITRSMRLVFPFNEARGRAWYNAHGADRLTGK